MTDLEARRKGTAALHCAWMMLEGSPLCWRDRTPNIGSSEADCNVCKTLKGSLEELAYLLVLSLHQHVQRCSGCTITTDMHGSCVFSHCYQAFAADHVSMAVRAGLAAWTMALTLWRTGTCKGDLSKRMEAAVDQACSQHVRRAPGHAVST